MAIERKKFEKDMQSQGNRSRTRDFDSLRKSKSGRKNFDGGDSEIDLDDFDAESDDEELNDFDEVDSSGKRTSRKRKSKKEVSHTTQALWAIGSFTLFLLSILASVGRAGSVGNYLYDILKSLLGLGYFLLPTFFLLLGYTFLKGIKRNYKTSRIIGALLFCVAGLGLIALLPSNHTGLDTSGLVSSDGENGSLGTLSTLASQVSGEGGIIGNMISIPLVGLFDIYITIIILGAIMACSLILIFEPSLDIIREASWSEFWARIRYGKDGLEKRNAGMVSGKEEAIIDATIRKSTASAGGSSLNLPLAGSINSQDKHRKILAQLGQNGANGANNQNGNSGANGKKAGQAGVDGGELDLLPESYLRNSSQNVKEFVPPPLTLLEKDKGRPEVGDIKANANIIKRTLLNFGIDVEMDEVSVGPSVTRYALKPAEGVKLSRIVGLNSDLALALAAHPIRIEAPIPGKSLVGIEIPNSVKSMVGLASLLSTDEYQNSTKPLLMALGKGVSGIASFANLAKSPHMLIAGATGSGKSVTIHAIITSLLFRNSPHDLKFIMIDPKRVELTLYNKIPHLLTPVITDAKKAIMALKWAGKEMSRRYDVLEANAVRDIESYHKMEDGKDKERMPYIVIVLDELADIMQTYPRELEAAIVRLAQMSRAVGIHLILSTQRPSVNVITGLIKANVPTRIALQVASQIDSRTILDAAGAEKLLGAGDMLYQGADMATPLRLQSAYISEAELKKVVQHLAKTYEDDIRSEISLAPNEAGSDAIFSSGLGAGSNDYDDEDEDDLYEEAKEAVIAAQKASTSYLQRKLGVGYSRAARLMDILEKRGVIGPSNGSKAREIISKNEGGSSPISNNVFEENGNMTSTAERIARNGEMETSGEVDLSKLSEEEKAAHEMANGIIDNARENNG